MVGTRVAPDNNDIVVWKLDDSAAPFINSSTSPSAVSHAISDLATLSGTVLLRQSSPFAVSGANGSVQFTATNSGSPRNFISGANNFEPAFPLSISGWLNLRSYNTTGFVQHPINKQDTAGVWSGITFDVVFMQNQSIGSSTYFFGLSTAGAQGTRQNFTVPLNTWIHIGLTYDGSNQITYLNGNIVAQWSSTGATTWGGHGPWWWGAIPAGSGNPEETAMSVCDFRFANIARPQSYFQNIYQQAILNNTGQQSVSTTFYKMRAFDLYYTTIPVYWNDSIISYANAPASPSGDGLGPIEIMDVWKVLNV
jgi:hypothetical protein